MPKLPILFLFIVSISCISPLDPVNTESSIEIPRSERIYFPCTKSNGSTDWEYCTPVRIDIGDYENLESITMTYDLVSTRGEPEFMAELFNETTGQSITLSQMFASPDGSMHTYAETPDLLPYLPKNLSDLIIRFRNTKNGASGYINDYSYMTITYK